MINKIIGDAKKGFNFIIKNPKLLVPDILFLFAILIISLIFVYVSGILNIIFSENFQESLRLFISNMQSLIRVIITLVIAALLTFLTGIWVTAAKYELIKNITANKKITLKEAFKNSKHYLTKILLIKIATFILYLIPISIIILIINIFKNTMLTVILLIMLFILLVILSISLMYKYPVLFLKNKNVKDVLLGSYSFFRKNIKYTFLLILTALVVMIFIGSISSALSLLILLTQNIYFLFIILVVIYTILRIIVNIIISVWVSTFIFISYKSKP